MIASRKLKAFGIALAIGGLAAAAWRLSGSGTGSGPGPGGNSKAAQPILRNQAPPPPEAYAGRAACAECHAAETRAFAGSDHARAMAVADDSTVLGRFEGDSLAHGGGAYRFLKDGKGPAVRAPGPDGEAHTYPVRYAFGVRPLQQYLVEFPGGRLQALPTAWDTRRSAWFHLQGDSVHAPDDWLHWTRDGQNWNGMCADCHSTGLRRGYDPAKGTFRTTSSEMDVSCEACHGPAAGHVAWAKAGTLRRRLLDASTRRTLGLPWNHARAGAQGGPENRAQVMACARCHARRSALREDFGYAKDFLDEYTPQLLTEGVYQGDGQILDEVYEYGSFLQSRMFHAGVACADCHHPHTLKPRATGNALCARCHEPARFDAPTHHRHAAGSPGSLCVDCHMPTRTYMGVDVRRDHSLRIPRPDQSVIYGTTNACGACHAGRGPAWAAEKIIAWHGPIRKAHFSDLLARGRRGGPGADSALAALAADTAMPAIARATAVSLLAAYMGGLAKAAVAAGATDREPLVRWAAASGAEGLPHGDRLAALGPLLKDSLRAVRAAAAGSLVEISPLLPESLRTGFAAALAEHRTALAANAVFPGGRFNLGRFHEARAEDDSAAREYRAALGIDNRFLPARMNLAQLLARGGRPDSAAAEFREALRRHPGYAEAHYSLGLLYGETGATDSAAVHMAAAETGMPGNARVSYNLGLLMAKRGRMSEAEDALRRALAKGGEVPDFLYALAWLVSQGPQPLQGVAILDRLAAVSPGYPGAAGLRAALASRRKTP